MDRRTTDRLIAVLVIGILSVGGYATLRAYWRLRTTSGMMQMMPGMDPIWYAFGTVVAVSAVLGTYAIVRDTFTSDQTSATTENPEISPQRETDAEQEQTEMASERDATRRRDPTSRLLDMLPEDERRVIGPVLESPGLTQVELRARSDFSKAKVSQTVTELEDRGLVYREKQGRTYRVYPGELLKDEGENEDER